MTHQSSKLVYAGSSPARVEKEKGKIKMTKKMQNLKKEIQSLNETANNKFQKAYELSQKYRIELVKYIRDNELLNRYKWIFGLDNYSIPYLYSVSEDDNLINNLMIDSLGYHYSLNLDLEDLVVFRSDDGKISIRFDERVDFAKFIKEWKIEVDYSIIDESIKKLKNRLNLLKEIKKAH